MTPRTLAIAAGALVTGIAIGSLGMSLVGGGPAPASNEPEPGA